MAVTRRRIVGYPALSAGSLFAGFAVLAVFAITAVPQPGIHGLDHYPSAFIGDSVLLPIVAWVLSLAAVWLPGRRTDWLWAGAGALVAAGGTFVTQLRWLEDDSPTLNWTIPQPHHFNAAGIWHLVYSCYAAGLLTALSMTVLIRLRRVDAATARGILAFVTALLCPQTSSLARAAISAVGGITGYAIAAIALWIKQRTS